MERPKLSVLCIEDEPDHAELLRCALESLNSSIDFHVHDELDGIAGAIGSSRVDVIFLDYRLGGVTGLEVLREIRRQGCDAPVIVLTAHGDEYVAAELTRAGADDYLVKHDLDPQTIRRCMATARQRAFDRISNSKLHTRIDQLESLSRALADSNVEIAVDARIDSLTELLNRKAWAEVASIEDERARRYERRYAVAMIDVDHFKLFNDVRGHQEGDRCLQAVGRCIRDTCRAVDLVGRYGGEEFVAMLPETSLADAECAGRRLVEAVGAMGIDHPGLDHAGVVSISVGVAVGPCGTSWDDVARLADEALYRAKASGRNQVCAASAEIDAERTAQRREDP